MKESDEFMADWRSAFRGQDNPKKLWKLQRNFEDFLKIWTPEDSLLDVGCNAGHIYNFLGKPPRYLGIDDDAFVIEKARKSFGEMFKVGDLFSLEETADVVLCSRVLMHLPRVGDAIAKLRSAARKYCVLFVPITAGKSSVDKCRREDRGRGQFAYFRTFSGRTLREHGDCIIHKHEPYSTVIYGPRLP